MAVGEPVVDGRTMWPAVSPASNCEQRNWLWGGVMGLIRSRLEVHFIAHRCVDLPGIRIFPAGVVYR